MDGEVVRTHDEAVEEGEAAQEQESQDEEDDYQDA